MEKFDLLEIIKKNRKDINLMDIIEIPDKELLQNARIQGMNTNEFGKAMSTSNEFIQKKLLEELLKDNELELSVRNSNEEKLSINNSQGYDLFIELKEQKIKIQSKLRQVNGKTPFSRCLHFETTRRNSQKNKNKNKTDDKIHKKRKLFSMNLMLCRT